MQLSASNLISQSLRDLGVLARGQTASAAQGADALDLLNALVDSWRIDGKVSILTFTRTVFGLTTNIQRYTIGSGGDIAITRPEWIEWVRVIPDNTVATTLRTELPCELFTLERWAAIVIKGQTGPYPTGIYYDRSFGNVTQRGNIDVWPIPTTANAALALYTPTPLGQFADITTVYEFAPGYPKALRTNLALELAPGYGKDVSPELQAAAATSKALVEINNISIPEMRCDAAIRRSGGYDIRSGQMF